MTNPHDDPRLAKQPRTLIADLARGILVSAASLWEIVVEVRIGKLSVEAGRSSGRSSHPDRFDHLVIVQAIAEDALLVSRHRNMLL
nr:hypothetical protein [uncultured Lichenicoccus sp.]